MIILEGNSKSGCLGNTFRQDRHPLNLVRPPVSCQCSYPSQKLDPLGGAILRSVIAWEGGAMMLEATPQLSKTEHLQEEACDSVRAYRCTQQAILSGRQSIKMQVWTCFFNMEHQKILLLLILATASKLRAFPFSASPDVDVIPRTTVFLNGLLGTAHFSGAAQNYSTLLLEEEAGILYVGGRGALYALNASDISTPASPRIEWDSSPEQKKQCLNKGRNNKTECFNHIRFLQRYNETHLYTCGTNAFRPLCAYIDSERFSLSSGIEDGRDRCPYDPSKGYTGLLVDGEMFTASQYEFRSSPDVRRNFPFPTLRTEEAPTRWLLEADFVGSALLRESINSSIGDDDKIYFFFTERSQEQMAYPSRTKVSRVARVCKVRGEAVFFSKSTTHTLSSVHFSCA
ncbi:semaphorin-4G-like [Corythoichthys intestinalis]|uniref:semaphorin-4G-like n=1 Tax=Corythoichthys intestinalis TaxID=161448 RepID=UPI0025A5C5D0|nr:semaphorin-4G-like [Corythoichthys intestinalis]